MSEEMPRDAEAEVQAGATVEPLLPEDLPEDHRAGFVGIIGKPNVGKSTLMNAYLGRKIAIVSDKPQTTRRRVLGILTLEDRAQIIFVDTPGIHHQPRHKLGEYMIRSATRAVPDADLVLFMVDVSMAPTQEDRYIAELLDERARVPVLLVLNKMDLLPPAEVRPHSEAYFDLLDYDGWMMISATRGDNRDELLDLVVDHLPAGPLYYPPDQITDQQERIIAAELVREQVLRFTYEEVPHSVAVLVDEFKRRTDDLTYISANIFVEKESQKGIVIGSGGSMSKRIGQAARKELERFLGHQVYLDLWVKVRKNWRKDEDKMRDLGFAVPKD